MTEARTTPPDSILIRRGTFSVLLPRRSALVAVGLGVLAAVAVCGSTVIGAAELSPGEAIGALFGFGSRTSTLLIQQFRLPRIVAGLLAGAALGAAGCLTQTLARNRLATPDFLGVDDGATAIILLTVAGGSTTMLGAWWAGPLGAVLAAVLVVLAAGGMGSQGYRILVVGLALSTVAQAVRDVMLAKSDIGVSSAIYTWVVGSLNGRGYPVVVPVAAGLALVLPPAVLAGRQLAVLRFDGDIAATLGVNLRRARLFVLAMAVLLAGLGVGVGGPIVFVAMAAPIIAGRLAGPERVPLISSALVGGALVVIADTLGRVVAAPVEIPVGVVTGVIGGPFLLWVLLSDKGSRRR